MTLIIEASSSSQKDLIVQGTHENFMREVIEKSHETLVLVDFWAQWCGPCQQLMPILEKVVIEMKGKVRLVKIDTDHYPDIAQQFNIQSLPTVLAFQGGQPIDGFAGLMSLTQLKTFITKLLGGQVSPFEELLDLADQARDHRDFLTAIGCYIKVLEKEEKNARALIGIARSYLATGMIDKAKVYTDMLPRDDSSEDIKSLKAMVVLCEEATALEDIQIVHARVQNHPQDEKAIRDLALHRFALGNPHDAIDLLFQSLGQSTKESQEAGRKLLLRFFDALGSSGDLTKQGRKRLSLMLFS